MSMQHLTRGAQAVGQSLADAWLAKAGLATLAALWGQYQEAYGALLIVIALDFATGVAAAARQCRLSSAIAKQKAVVKLLAYATVLIAVYQLERALQGSPFAWGSDFTLSAALLYLIGTEVISIVENLETLSGLRLRVFSGHKRLIDALHDEKKDGPPKTKTPRPPS